jgi:hypothetical protein
MYLKHFQHIQSEDTGTANRHLVLEARDLGGSMAERKPSAEATIGQIVDGFCKSLGRHLGFGNWR